MSINIYWMHQTLTLITLSLILIRAIIASLRQLRGKPVWGHRFLSITANAVLDTQIVFGIFLFLFGTKPSVNHLLLVAVAAILAHYSYSVEKRHGSSVTTLVSAWGAVVPVIVLFI